MHPVLLRLRGGVGVRGCAYVNAVLRAMPRAVPIVWPIGVPIAPLKANGAALRSTSPGESPMTSFAHQAAQIDTAALSRYLEARLPGFKGPIAAEKTPTRAVEPDLPARLAQRPLRAAQEAAGPAPEERARGRPRVPRHEGARGHRRAGAAHAASCARTTACIGTAFFVMEFVDGTVFWDPALPELEKAQRTKVYDEENRALAALHLGRSGQGRARRLRQGGQLLRPPARPLDQAVPRLGDRAHRGHGDADRVAGEERAARRRPRLASCTATTASTT